MKSFSRMAVVLASAVVAVLVAACGDGSSDAVAAGGSGGTGMAVEALTTCQQACVDNNPTTYQKFDSYELTECGCAANSPCHASCTAECANPSTLTQSSPCGTCLQAEFNKENGSVCTIHAAINDCLPDPACAQFVNCLLTCP